MKLSDKDKIIQALRFAVDYMTYHGCQQVDAEPHNTVGGPTECELKCIGCSAEGIARWPHWKAEFAHDPDCRWVAFLETLKENDIEINVVERY